MAVAMAMATLRAFLRRRLLVAGEANSVAVNTLRFSSLAGNGVGGGTIAADLADDETKRRLFNRLRYRSKQRGFLELDLVLGTWVEENLPSLDDHRIRSLVHLLDVENPDLWKWLTGQEKAPEMINTNPVFMAVQSKVLENIDKHAAPEARSAPGQPWVRGWDDKRGLDGPKYGNQ